MNKTYTNTATQILNLVNKYQDKIKKIAQWSAAARTGLKVGVQLLPFILPAVGKAVNEIRTGKSVIDDITKLISKLNEYKQSYPEDYNKYQQQFDDFIKYSKQLQDLYKKIDSNSESVDILNDIEQYLSVSYEVQILAGAIRGYMDELKGLGGKAFDLIQMTGLEAGLQTLTTDIQLAIDALFKHLSMSSPPIQAKLEKLKSQVKELQKNEGAQPSEESAASSEEKKESAEAPEESKEEIAYISDEFKKQLEELA